MRDALLRDLKALETYQLITMDDARLTPSDLTDESIAVYPDQFKQVFLNTLQTVDYVWLIAPETNGILLDLSQLCYEAEKAEQGPKFIGSGFDTMLIGTSKTLCYEALRDARIHTLPVHAGEDLLNETYFNSIQSSAKQAWVAKPEDGAGCEGIRLFDSLQELKRWLQEDNRYLNYLAQPYQPGIAASLSMLCRNGKAWLLSVNTQQIVIEDSQFKLKGVCVNAIKNDWQRFETIARKIAQMLPDALGYIGVDVIIGADQNKIFVLEINPRLTTSYVGLSKGMKINPAKLILDCVLNDAFKMPVANSGQLLESETEVTL